MNARARARLVPLLALVPVAIAVALALLLGGSNPQGPATGAASLVPADALTYIHLSTDGTRPGVRNALRLAARLPDYPLLVAAVTTRLGAILGGGSSAAFYSDIRPWLGKEAAFALLNTPTATAGSLIVLDVRDRRRARTFLDTAGATPTGTYDGAQLYRYRTGTEAAFSSHYLAIGQDASVRGALDVAAGRSQSLSRSSSYRRAARGEPSDRVLDAYVSAAGVRRVLAPQGGLLGALGGLLYQPALAGTAASLSAVSGGARIKVHSALDPGLVRVSGHRATTFSPTLEKLIPTGSMLLLDISGLDRVAPAVLGAGAEAGVAGRVGPLLGRLGGALSSEGVDVHSIVSIFHGETVVALTPHGSAPSLIIIARTRHESATRDQLAALEAPLAQLFPPPSSGPGQAAEFNDRQVAGVTAHQLSLAPGFQIDYAVFRGLVVVSTSLEGIGAVAHHRRSLADQSSYRAAVRGRPDRVTSLLFLDFSQLLSLGEQTGLTRSARFRALRPDLEKVRAIGLHSTSGEADTTAELFLQIS